jgi:hypothetical protein
VDLYATAKDAVKVKIQPNVLSSTSVTTSSNVVAATATYTFSFTVTNSIPSSGIIEVIFPLD